MQVRLPILTKALLSAGGISSADTALLGSAGKRMVEPATKNDSSSGIFVKKEEPFFFPGRHHAFGPAMWDICAAFIHGMRSRIKKIQLPRTTSIDSTSDMLHRQNCSGQVFQMFVTWQSILRRVRCCASEWLELNVVVWKLPCLNACALINALLGAVQLLRAQTCACMVLSLDVTELWRPAFMLVPGYVALGTSELLCVNLTTRMCLPPGTANRRVQKFALGCACP